MIITENKSFDEICEHIKKTDNIGIIGCAQCATSCSTGGEKQVNELAEKLSEAGYTVNLKTIIDPPCDERMVKKDFKSFKNEYNKCSTLIVMACGAGVSIISKLTDNKNIVAALNGVFLGSMKRLGIYNEYCSLCGNCVLSLTGGICPVTRCAKGLLNGPCGGVINGKYCEVHNENRCAWSLIIEKLKNLNKLENLYKITGLKDYSKYTKPNYFDKKKG